MRKIDICEGNRKVSPEKLRIRDKIIELIKKNSTIVISSVKGIPSSQLQRIRHKLKNTATIIVVKKNIMKKALEEATKILKDEKITTLANYLNEGCTVIFSQLNPFELAYLLADERINVKAKAGQRAIEDIKIEAGPTEIPAGPMISHLNNAGIKIAIEGGKITIKESKVLVRKGEEISENIANILSKLEITPFTVGLDPIVAFDANSHNIYVGIKVDKEATLQDIKQAFINARSLAIFIEYPTKESIGFMIAKASLQANAINSLIKTL